MHRVKVLPASWPARNRRCVYRDVAGAEGVRDDLARMAICIKTNAYNPAFAEISRSS